jgi:hypothetical protein
MDFFTPHQTTVWLWELLLLFFISITAGLILSLTYRMSGTKNQQAAQPFAWLMVVMPALVSVIIFMVEDNFLRAVYLLGATTLIRFRNPVKNPFTTIIVLATVGAGAAAGFGFYLGALLLALFCLATVGIGNRFSEKTGNDVVRILYLDCDSLHYPDRILKNMGKWLKKWVKLSIETSTTDDRSHWYYQVYIRDESSIDELIRQFKNQGITAAVLVPQDLREF